MRQVIGGESDASYCGKVDRAIRPRCPSSSGQGSAVLPVQPFSLIEALSVPFRRASGVTDWLSPAGLTDRIQDDPIVAFAWPRADLNAAAHELLIGLLATTCTAQARDRWPAWWNEPPGPAALAERFAQ